MLVSREIICYRSADLYEVWSRINIDILTRLTATIWGCLEHPFGHEKVRFMAKKGHFFECFLRRISWLAWSDPLFLYPYFSKPFHPKVRFVSKHAISYLLCGKASQIVPYGIQTRYHSAQNIEEPAEHPQ